MLVLCTSFSFLWNYRDTSEESSYIVFVDGVDPSEVLCHPGSRLLPKLNPNTLYKPQTYIYILLIRTLSSALSRGESTLVTNKLLNVTKLVLQSVPIQRCSGSKT